MKKVLFNLLESTRSFLYKLFAGKGIGRKFPILWRIYDLLYRAFAPQKIFFHEMEGSKFLVDLAEKNYHMRKIMEGYTTIKTHEPETTALFKRTLRAGDTVLDIGASIGYFTFLAAKCVGPRGRVYAFEPTEANFKYLCENRLANSAHNVSPFKLAAWDKNEPIKAPVSEYQSFISIWTNGIVLDDFLPQQGVRKVDFIKIDVDGAEPWVLRGLLNTFKNNQGLKMVIEYYPKYIEGSGGSPQEVMDILNSYFVCKPIENDYGDGYWNLYCERKP